MPRTNLRVERDRRQDGNEQVETGAQRASYLFILSAGTENKLDYVFPSAVLDLQLQKISSKEIYGGTFITTLLPRSKTHE